MVSIHAPVKVRHCCHMRYFLIDMVSIHAPVKVRRAITVPLPSANCFNSRTRKGATTNLIDACKAFNVSIHAPVKVRLVYHCLTFHCPFVSIHAPVKVRQCIGISKEEYLSFNSRTRKGATFLTVFNSFFYFCFNSRTRKGATTGRIFAFNTWAVSIHAPVKVRLL